MTRDAFCTEFIRGMRYVIQKHDRLNAAQPGGARDMAQANLDGAIEQLADHIYDALIGVGRSHAA